MARAQSGRDATVRRARILSARRYYDVFVPTRVTLRQAGVAAGAFVCLLVIGTVGFMLLLDENVFDALFRTINTVYTAGLFDAPESTAAKAFTLFLVVGGVAIFLYVFALLVEIAVSGTVGGAWQRRRTQTSREQARETTTSSAATAASAAASARSSARQASSTSSSTSMRTRSRSPTNEATW